jgi:hypothetical protein
MAMGNGNGDGNGVGNKDRDGNGNCNGYSHGKGNNDKGRVASSCAGNVQCYGRGDTLPPPPWTQKKCIHQRSIMGVTLLRVFPPFQGGGFLTAHHGLFFWVIFTTTVQLTEQPLIAPCIIQALKNPVSPLTLYLLHSSKNPVSLLMIYPGSYCTFCQGKPGQGLQ